MIYYLLFALFCVFLQPSIAASQDFPILSPTSSIEKAGFSQEGLRAVEDFITEEIKKGYPNTQIIITKDNSIVYHKAFGYRQIWQEDTLLKNPPIVNTDTLYDIASNTKMFATVFTIQKLLYEKKIQLSSTVHSYFPEFVDNPNSPITGKDTITIEDLLYHRSGLPPYIDYFDPVLAKDLFAQDKKTMIQSIFRTDLIHKPRTENTYSDLDFILLGLIIEKIVAMPLDTYAEEYIYRPLGLKNTLYTPLQKKKNSSTIAATERNGNTRDHFRKYPNIRTKTIIGEVHDERSYYMGQVAGHAGLFSTASDLAVLAQVMLNGGGYGSVQLFSKDEITLFTTPSVPNPSFGMGWRLNKGDYLSWMFSTLAPNTAYGHTGFTGTLSLIDPTNNMAIIFFSSKKHSPVVNPKEDPNFFVGDTFTISKYGKLVELIYAARTP
ncbi:MAG: penicillin binding protein PBP4B [Desulfovibrionaceae bacterium]